MASIWVFFSPLLHVGDVVEALYLSANSSLSAVSFACSALFYWISLSYGWLATSTTAKAVGAFLSRQVRRIVARPCYWNPPISSAASATEQH